MGVNAEFEMQNAKVKTSLAAPPAVGILSKAADVIGGKEEERDKYEEFVGIEKLRLYRTSDEYFHRLT